MSDENTVAITPLRKMLQRFNEDLGQYINAEERFKLGRVLTIIDAAISDPDQRKAIKDLVQNEWWGGSGNRIGELPMTNPHTDLRGICAALGFELYDPSMASLPEVEQHSSQEAYATSRYKKLAKED